MKIAILGAGAVGSYYGATLQKKGFDVTLICRGEHYKQIINKGLKVKSHWGDYKTAISASDNIKKLGIFDVIFFTPKLYSNIETLPLLKDISNEKTIVITIQNGVNSHNEISKFIDTKQIIPAATFIEAEIVSPGVIMQQGSTALVEMGFLERSQEKILQDLKTKFDSEFLSFNISNDILHTLWKKMIIVGAFGTIMTSFRMSFRELIDSKYGEKILSETMKEIKKVGISENIQLDSVNISEIIKELRLEADEMTSSMFNDLKSKKPLEIDSILGHVVNLAQSKNIDLPYSETLVSSLENFKRG
tara:strand:+ start:10202 stop:11113 length:912 start_codon:yes stop_codon:yes gene_type:complete